MAKAMVVDDSRAMRMILARILRELSFEVKEASNGLEALAAIQGEWRDIELILVDWNMPEMNGLELVREIREDASLASLVIVMVTTETEIDQMMLALTAGANEYVMKPFTREILVEKLQIAGAMH